MSDTYALCGATIFDGQRLITDQAIIISDQRIKHLCPQHEVPSAMTQYDFSGQLISAGFIDLQVNGCGGVMFNGAPSQETLHIMHQANLKSGTTSFLPTFITASEPDMTQALNVGQRYQQNYPFRSLGLHLEGPFISRAKRGIHTEDYIRPLNDEDVAYLINQREQIGLLTVAPENASPEQISRLVQSGIRVAVGHSNASYEQTMNAFAAGADYATHLYNAMSGLKGRELGVLGAIFDRGDVYSGIIADGLHLDFASLRIAKHLLTSHLYLVTDAIAPANSDITEFDFVGRAIHVEEGRCIGDDGTLGGSMLTMNEAVRNCVEHAGISLEEALRMATIYPARAMGLAHQIGRIQTGCWANLAVMDPSDLSVTAVINDGQLLMQEAHG